MKTARAQWRLPRPLTLVNGVCLCLEKAARNGSAAWSLAPEASTHQLQLFVRSSEGLKIPSPSKLERF